MYTYCSAADFVELQSAIEDWFHKHPTVEIPVCDIRLFAAPRAHQVDVITAVSRLVKQGDLIRKVDVQNGYFSKAYYSLNPNR